MFSGFKSLQSESRKNSKDHSDGRTGTNKSGNGVVGRWGVSGEPVQYHCLVAISNAQKQLKHRVANKRDRRREAPLMHGGNELLQIHTFAFVDQTWLNPAVRHWIEHVGALGNRFRSEKVVQFYNVGMG